MIDPRDVLIGYDANALDRTGTALDRQVGLRDVLIDRFRALLRAGILRVVVADGLRQEIAHPHTPQAVRETVPREAPPSAFQLRPGLTAAQHISRMRVRAIVQGNARPGKHEADAAHLSEAYEAGCAYFITHDGRLLRKRADLEASLPGLGIVTLEDFFDIFDSCADETAE